MTSQYSDEGVADYQTVFGRDFLSPGGPETARRFLSKLELPKGALVLDLCCGLGGAAFLMTSEFGWNVEGLDLTESLLDKARARSAELGLSVTFEQGDCLQMERPERYDAVYCRDSFLHIADKSKLCSVLYHSLKPGGQLLFTDYCCGEKPWSEEFESYVSQRGYHLSTLSEYEELLSNAGFSEVESTDLTDEFVEILESDLEGISSEPMRQSWQGKLGRARRGEQRWGMLYCRR